MTTQSDEPPVLITALDFPTDRSALALAERLDPSITNVKVGKELFTASGPALVEKLQRSGFRVFLDLKFHDIPNTVAGALRSSLALGVWMVNVHAGGGRAMLEAARDAIPADSGTLLIAVTVLTSIDDGMLAETGVPDGIEKQVGRLAGLTQASGLDGVVCSPRESRQMKARFGQDFLLVTPGVRPADVDSGDQRRVMTPTEAMQAGSDYLVIGRPITAAPDPAAALDAIAAQL